MEKNMTSSTTAEERAAAFKHQWPRELLVEAIELPKKVASMNAKPMLRILPILDVVGRFSEAATAYVACSRGCNHCCHIQVAITGLEAQLLGNRIGVKPVVLQQPRLRPQESFDYNTPCTFLENNECSIYDNRPFVCRNHSSFETSADSCRLTDENGGRRQGVQLLTPDFPGVKEALNVVVNLVGRTDYADIRDYFPNGRTG